MDYLRKFIIKQSEELKKEFSDMLLTFLTSYNVLVWNYNWEFSSYLGHELLNFIENAKTIKKFLNTNFVKTQLLKDLYNSLLIWKKITPFFTITTIDDTTKYEQDMNNFVENVKKFYDIGKRSFMTKTQKKVGGDETFYLHCLRYYMPKIAKDTLDKHKLGLGIFTMQGFERRNKESKNTLRRFCNGKGDILSPNLKRLYDVFHYEHSSY